MAKKYNEDYDIRIAPEFSGQDSNLRTTSKSQKYFLIFLVAVGIYSGFQRQHNILHQNYNILLI